jgi:hypothetical protein
MGRLLLIIGALLLIGSAAAQRSFDVDILAETFGFDDATKKTVPLDKLMQGCPARDCIPSIDNPKYVPADKADHVSDDDLVITLAYKGEHFAFPTKILDHHEIVNDTFAGVPLAITWCPLCGSAVGIERSISGSVTEFGVSGVLYNSDLVLYDRASETLWDQIEAKGIVGPRTDERLTLVPVSMSKWARWKTKHPDTLVLTTETGFDEDYTGDRYAEYRESTRLFMPVSATSERLHAKTVVYGFELDAGEIAYTEKLLAEPYTHEFAGKETVVSISDDGAVTMRRDGEVHYPIRLFWFAWYTFHPETELAKVAGATTL